MKRLSIVSLTFLLSACNLLNADGNSDDTSFKRKDGSSITYYLNSKSSETLLVLIQGSDCNSVAHNTTINNHFSKLIAGADILTVEKYGITQQLTWNPSGDSAECPKSYYIHDSPKQRVQDYLQTIHALKQRNNYQSIILVGGSEGALVAAMIAAKSDFVSAVVSINGGGQFFLDDVFT